MAEGRATTMTRAEYQKARRVFEDTLAKMQRAYAPEEDVLLEATATDEAGQIITVARYKVYVDGRIECFEILDHVLWPSL
jgi:hypothetical protein